ncbi:hypothetical protein S40285_10622 [Stachybotrys chlorohalonatus IBT 40285]|uniref:Uncharacterized protein n=1 Tax=Stachybotrys chlorohalonatus (strain IBT 40285) TaxID=1283841 RepID=A0A084R0X5_STAC4|nr:hypothetical protein S40285_10622 [Stachybotrys chlorohalonata IBT 40285]
MPRKAQTTLKILAMRYLNFQEARHNPDGGTAGSPRKLPSQREFAHQHGISEMSFRRGIKAIKRQGNEANAGAGGRPGLLDPAEEAALCDHIVTAWTAEIDR